MRATTRNVLVAAILCGCAGAQHEAATARDAVADVGDGLERARSGLLALCDERPPRPPLDGATRARCDEAIDGLNAAIAGFRVARLVVP